ISSWPMVCPSFPAGCCCRWWRSGRCGGGDKFFSHSACPLRTLARPPKPVSFPACRRSPKPSDPMSLPVLIVLHQENSTPGRVGQYLRKRGVPLDIRRPIIGDPLPETLEHHAGAIVFGGPQSANDDLDFIRREIAWLGVPLKEDKPFLGICLGGQMLARHLGARVDAHGEGQ